jgi:hypothetical protein
METLRERLVGAGVGDPLRKILNPMLSCGPAVIEHALLTHGFPPNASVGEGCDPVRLGKRNLPSCCSLRFATVA